MNERFSLGDLQMLIRDSLYLSLPQMFWVTAEISEITVNSSGHCYLELIEKNADERNIRARIRGIIWSSRFGFISSLFGNITGDSLRSGLKILVKARVEYHEIYGLSLVISDIDPSFTIGEMAVRRQMIIKRLQDEGIFDMNRETVFPLLPQRIAVISSGQAAGFSDFVNHLRNNSYGYVFYTLLVETPMQGTDTEQGVISSLDRIAEHADLFDLVVIIRGGGSQTDLSWFDSYDIAFHVTQFPLPVVTGIGHEKNMSVTDLVACRALKTPTAVADLLIDSMASAENKLNEMSVSIKDLAVNILGTNRLAIDSYGIKLQPLARLLIAGYRERLSGKVLELGSLSRRITLRNGLLASGLSSRLKASAATLLAGRQNRIQRSQNELKMRTATLLGLAGANVKKLESGLNLLDPGNVLRRGFTITSKNGKIIRSSAQAGSDDIIDTTFADGTVRSRVTGQAKNAKGVDGK